MESKILLDTSIIIRYQRGDVGVRKVFIKNASELFVSRITAIETIYGSVSKTQKKKNMALLESLQILEINTNISKMAYALTDKYALKTGIGIADVLIAATSIEYKIKLWVNDKHFSQIKEVEFYLP